VYILQKFFVEGEKMKRLIMLITLVVAFSFIGCGSDDDGSSSSAKSSQTGTETPKTTIKYQQGNIDDEVYLELLRDSVAQTSGSLVQAILSINTLLFTDNTTTSLDTFIKRKQQVDQALSALESNADITDQYMDLLPTQKQAQAYIARNSATIKPEEVEAILNSSKMGSVLKPLMKHYKVNARKAKEILDNAMDGLYTKYSNEAQFNENMTNVLKVVRDGSALAVTIGSAVVTAGASTAGLGAAGTISTVVQGADGFVKLTKSSAELILGRDGALDDFYKKSAVISGLSFGSEMLCIKSLFTKPENAGEAISNLVYMSFKEREVAQDEVIAFGPVSFDYGSYINWTPDRDYYLKFLASNYKGVVAYPSEDGYRVGESVQKVDKQQFKEFFKEPLKALDDIDKIEATKIALDGNQDSNNSGDDNGNNVLSCPLTSDITFESASDTLTCEYTACSDGINHLSRQTSLMNGLKNGVSISYNCIGTIISKVPYSNDKIDGVLESYYESGALWEKRYYTQGSLDGNWIYYYETGVVKWAREYANDVQVGKDIKYYEDGSVMTCKIIVDGEVAGDCESD